MFFDFSLPGVLESIAQLKSQRLPEFCRKINTVKISGVSVVTDWFTIMFSVPPTTVDGRCNVVL